MKATSKLEFLSQFPLFDVLTEEELTYLNQCTDSKSYKKYDKIYLEGDFSDAIFFLTKGVIKIATHSHDGREVIKSILHPHAMFGELGLLGEEKKTKFCRSNDRSGGMPYFKDK